MVVSNQATAAPANATDHAASDECVDDASDESDLGDDEHSDGPQSGSDADQRHPSSLRCSQSGTCRGRCHGDSEQRAPQQQLPPSQRAACL